MKTSLRSIVWAFIPSPWRLPIQFWRYRITGYIEPEMLLIRLWKDRNSISIDVGASEGIYSFELSRWFSRVESFEPNPYIAANLQRYNSRRIRFHSVALSSIEGKRKLYVPLSADGTQIPGWGTFHPDALSDSPKCDELTVTLRTLDSYGFNSVAFIKIDVEGHEQDVLAGSDRTLSYCRPVVLIEVKSAARAAVQRFFSMRDYQLFFLQANNLHKLTDDKQRVPYNQENFFAIPMEKATPKVLR